MPGSQTLCCGPYSKMPELWCAKYKTNFKHHMGCQNNRKVPNKEMQISEVSMYLFMPLLYIIVHKIMKVLHKNEDKKKAKVK